MDMKKLKCQAPHVEGKGCYTCGGYGYLASQGKCGCCGRLTWFRPDPYTTYCGKQYRTFDGLEMTDHMINGKIRSFCPDCSHEACDTCSAELAEIARDLARG